MTSPLFRGVIPALVTPFRAGAFDADAFKRLVERQIAGGSAGLVPLGTTGEAATLSAAERTRTLELCLNVAAGRVPVIAGTGVNDTAETIERTRHAKTVGADAALVVTPYYNRPSQEGLYGHYMQIADAVELPLIVYNVPGRTGVDLSDATLARLAQHPNIVGVKDATGNLERLSLQRLQIPGDFAFLSGDDPSWLGYMAHGGHGVISVTANIAPEAMASQCSAIDSRDRDGALAWQDRLIRLHKALFLDASPAPTKFALARLGLCTEEVRAPLAACRADVRSQIEAAMVDAGVN